MMMLLNLAILGKNHIEFQGVIRRGQEYTSKQNRQSNYQFTARCLRATLRQCSVMVTAVTHIFAAQRKRHK